MIRNKTILVFILLIQLSGFNAFASDGCSSCFVSMVSCLFHDEEEHDTHHHDDEESSNIAILTTLDNKSLCNLCICRDTHFPVQEHERSNQSESISQTLDLPPPTYSISLLSEILSDFSILDDQYKYLTFEVSLRLRV